MLPERWRAALPVVAAVAVVAALSLLTVTAMSSFGADDDDDRAFVDADASSTTTTEASRRIAPRPTTTTTRPEPEVLGETVQRDPDSSSTTSAPGSTTSPTPTTAPAAPAPSAAPRPPAPTPTTAPAAPPTTVCRNSTDPGCGELSWSPQPEPYEVEVYAVSTPVAAAAGEPVTFAIDYVDPSGVDALGACINWSAPDAEVDVSSCEEIATACERTGPHDPPAPSQERIRVERTFTFEQPGTYEVTVGGNVATHLADECPSPYRNTMERRTFLIEVG